jgi:hypothetical protein
MCEVGRRRAGKCGNEFGNAQRSIATEGIARVVDELRMNGLIR